jgi:drug/metabolite transporter (DMT)-like permease
MPKTLKYAFIVFCGGACYGFTVPLVRTEYALGFTTAQVMLGQYLFGVMILGILVLLFSRYPVALKQTLQLLGIGIVGAGASFFYYRALALLTSAAALTLLFQFTWMGVLLHAILERKLPSRMTLLAVVLVVAGTFLAAGVFEDSGGSLNLIGVIDGLLSAVFYTVFLRLSGKVATDLPAINRTFFTALGSLIVTLGLTPSLLHGAEFTMNFLWIGIPLATIGIVAPVILIQKGASRLPGSVTAIMASSELPSGILMGVLFIGDPLTFLIFIGVVVVLVGIVLSQFDELHLALQHKPTPKE